MSYEAQWMQALADNTNLQDECKRLKVQLVSTTKLLVSEQGRLVDKQCRINELEKRIAELEAQIKTMHDNGQGIPNECGKHKERDL
jgi:cell division protein FtsB